MKKMTDSWSALRFIGKYLLRQKKDLLFGISALISVDLLQLLIPKLIGKTVDSLSTSSPSHLFATRNCLIIIAIALIMVLCRFLWRYFVIGGSRKIEAAIRTDMFSHLTSLSFTYFNKTKTGDLMALLINDLNAVRMASGLGIIGFVDMLFLGTMSLMFMFSINPILTLICTIPLPIIIFIMLSFSKILQTRFKLVQESFSNISAHAQESLSGIRVIKSFVQESDETMLLYKKSQDYAEKNISLVKIWGFFFPSVSLLASLSFALFYLVGSRFAILRTITIGEFISFTFYLNTIIWPMMAVGFVFNLLSRGIASAKRIMELMNTQPEATSLPSIHDANLKGSITIKNLSFSYSEGGPLVLKNINLFIPANSSIGIMGKPGSGKSTFVALLFRLFKVPDATVFFDEYDCNTLPLKTLRSSMSYVPQDSFLFSDSIINNITLGLTTETYDLENIESIVKKSAINDDINRFSQGFHTMIGERGITLSGGQKQRLCLARALILNAKILIMDDALSAVDSHTEALILKSLEHEIKKRTSIIIAQRVSTVKRCDQIIMIDKGEIIEQGTHDQLIANQGFYAHLAQLQTLEDEYD